MADKTDDDTNEPKPAATFKTDAEWAKARAKLINEGKKEAERALLEKLGVESFDDVEALKGEVEKSKATKTESDQLRAELKKLQKDRDAAAARVAELTAFQQSTVKRNAIMAHASKTRDPDVLVELLSSKVTLGDDGSVDLKAVEALVTQTLAEKDYLRAPGFKQGAGTSSTPPKASASQAGTNGTTEKPMSLAERMMAFHTGQLHTPGDG